MADYNDYLAYLHHVDDTTLQEFKKKEDELRHQIDVIREQCRKDINDIRERAAAEKEQLEADHKAVIASLTAQCQSDVDKITAEKEAAEQKLSTALAEIEEGKRLAVEQALAKINEEHESTVGTLRFQYQSSIDKLNAEIKQLKESNEKELQRITAEKDAQILKLSEKLAIIEAERFSFRKVMNKIKEFVLSLFMSADSNIDDAFEKKRLDVEKKARQEEEKRRRLQEEESSRKEEESGHYVTGSESVEGEHRFCRVCGNPLKPGAVFCNKCGTKVK